MKLTKSQSNVINALINEYHNKKRKIINFSAPTGSGKTFMSANFISRIFADHSNDNIQKTMFVVATISNSKLPQFFAEKLEQYKQYLPFKNFSIDFRESPSQSAGKKMEHIEGFGLENNKVLVFGTSSFGRKKIFTEMGILDNFTDEAKQKKWNIIYIRDEAHKGGASGTSETFYKRFDDKMVELANFTIQMTATPKNQNDLIELKEEDLENDGVYLLKRKLIYNDFQKNTSTRNKLIKACLDKFIEIQKEYKKLKKFIRPALLIQVDSKSKNISQNEYDKTIKEIIQIVSEEYKLKYLKYFSNNITGNTREEQSLFAASKHDSNYDVIIFKVGPATGWDIPRACMLLQIREVSSQILNQQTIGRIKRNPIENLELNEITNKYYIYSNYQEGKRKLAFYKLKEKFSNLKLYKGNLSLCDKSMNLVEKEYYNRLVAFFNQSAILDFILENNVKSHLSIQNIVFNNNATDNHYSREVFSIFKLKIWIHHELKNNKKYFTKDLHKIIYQLKLDTNVSENIIIYTLLTEYLLQIKKIYSKSYKKYKHDEVYKLIPNQGLKPYYEMWKSSNNILQIDITNMENYGYTQIKSINSREDQDIQFLDSYPEKIFMYHVFKEINKNNNLDINFFAKMPTLGSKIFIEYFKSEDGQKHMAFIDFAIVCNQKILMVEVKGWNDYDECKTKDLLYAFSKYKEQNPNYKIELLLCYSGKEDGKDKHPEVKFMLNTKIKSFSINKMFKHFLD